MNNDLDNNLGCGMDMNIGKNFWNETRNNTIKQTLLLLLGQVIVATVLGSMIFLPAYLVQRFLTKKQAMYLTIGILVPLLVFLGYSLFKFLADTSTIKITRKNAMIALIVGVISLLFSIGWHFTPTSKNQLLCFVILFIITSIVGIFFSLLPEYPPEIELTKTQLFLAALGYYILIMMSRVCLALFSGNNPDKIISDS